jgi:ADP-ribose pyrophosphatase
MGLKILTAFDYFSKIDFAAHLHFENIKVTQLMKLISSNERYRSSIFWVTEDHAVDPDGFEIHRAIVRHAGSAVMIPVDERGRVLLVRQYRLPVRGYLWEFPAGRLDPGETPLQACKRELMEETGFRARRWKKLVSFWVSPGYVAEKMHLYVATELIKGEASPMEDERIEMRWFKPNELDNWIKSGKIQDAKTIIGFLRWSRDRSSR